MKVEAKLPLEQWLWMHRLIGKTQGTLGAISLQIKEGQEHFLDPIRMLEEEWDAFLESVKTDEEKKPSE